MALTKSQIKTLKSALAKVNEAKEMIETLRDEMQDAHDNKSERWQESEAGEASGELNDMISGLADSIENTEGEFGNFEMDD